MGATSKIAKNSLWLILQPLLLNVISLAVTGYIARTLGKADYGIFIFANAFTLMFLPIGDMGLRAITIRTLAEKPPDPALVLGRFFTLRALCIVIGFLLVVVIINLMSYPLVTKIVVYIAGLALIPRAITTTAHDTFEAHEQMKYVAYSDSAAGLTLTALSLVVLLLGFRLYALITSYLIGRIVGLFLAMYFVYRKFIRPRYNIDLPFFKSSLARGAIFFYPTFVFYLSKRLGIVLLSKFANNASVGLFGAANELVDKFIIIPEGICGAFFPTLVSTFKRSPEDAKILFQRFYEYSFLIALPVAIGGHIVAPQIIQLIYGDTYLESIVVFQIMLWALMLHFLVSLASWTLGAIHHEKLGAIAVLTTTPIFLAICLVAIPYGREVGLAGAMLIKDTLTFIMIATFTKKVFQPHLMRQRIFFGIAGAALIMGAVVWLFNHQVTASPFGLFVSIPLGGLVYGGAIFALRVISFSDIRNFRSTMGQGADQQEDETEDKS